MTLSAYLEAKEELAVISVHFSAPCAHNFLFSAGNLTNELLQMTDIFLF